MENKIIIDGVAYRRTEKGQEVLKRLGGFIIEGGMNGYYDRSHNVSVEEAIQELVTEGYNNFEFEKNQYEETCSIPDYKNSPVFTDEEYEKMTEEEYLAQAKELISLYTEEELIEKDDKYGFLKGVLSEYYKEEIEE